ncbi:hypothetical protein BDN72DRAFT_838835 [Pluteus cervinus]|uniref:Uncharacterized protein n=1 Tax=Pluteus cervinus TaxID=181527 RepID=A0ACD3AYX5_9AGAR|nr:hypothetical protein BDN72DRAFT_838835 [Pluteus cervinus]
MATSILFPAEVVDNIISQLTHDLPSLKAISLTCRQWLRCARPFLYKSIIVPILLTQPATTGDMDSAMVPTVLKSPGYKPKYTTHLTLRSSPLVKLAFSPSLSVGLLLDPFTNLHTLTLSRLHLSEFPTIPTGDTFSRRITTLRIHRLYYSVLRDVIALILAFSSVRCLSLHPLQDERPSWQSSHRDLVTNIPPSTLPPVQCFGTRLDISSPLPMALLDMLKVKGSTRRLSITTALGNALEFRYLSEIIDYIRQEKITTWDLGLNWNDRSRFSWSSIDNLRFDELVNLHTWTLSLLDFSTTRKRALTYVFIQHILQSFRRYRWNGEFLNFHRFTLSFISPSTSRRDIRRTLGIRTSLKPGELGGEDNNNNFIPDLNYNDVEDLAFIDEKRGGSVDLSIKCGYDKKGNLKITTMRDVWSLCDMELAESLAGLPNLHEVVVEVRASGGAEGDDDLDREMGVEELSGLVNGLFPDCVGRGLVVRAEMGPVGRISGIWDRHECTSELP